MKAFIALISLVTCLTFSLAADKSLMVYSARKTQLVEHVFKKYEDETGIKINFITDKEGPLLQKLQAEGKRSPADLLITVDAGNLWSAKKAGILSPVTSSTIEKNIPSFYRDPDNYWHGLSVRSRTMVYNTNKVQPSDLSTYEDLANPKWKGRLALRTSKKVYNQSLVAMLIERLGKDKTKEIVKGWVNNLAAPVFMKDSLALEAVAAGQGDVCLVNTYYFGRLMQAKPDLPLKIFWPNQKTSGVHVNVSGIGIVKASKKKDMAKAFIEWLSSEKAQNLFADVNMEYPVNPKVQPHEFVANWGTFKPDQINLSKAGELQKSAILLMDAAQYK